MVIIVGKYIYDQFIMNNLAPADFTATTKSNVIFRSNMDLLCTDFVIEDDDVALEGNEEFLVSFTIRSSNTTAQPGDTPTSTVTIIDNDGENKNTLRLFYLCY